MFDPGIGRWFGEDPIDFGAGDADLYRYVGNNPTNATDPSGLQAIPGRQLALDAAAGQMKKGVGQLEPLTWDLVYATAKALQSPTAIFDLVKDTTVLNIAAEGTNGSY